MPRLVVPGYPHHVTQRGNRRMKTFFSPEDYRAYLDLIVDCKDDVGVEVWAYCLVTNHVLCGAPHNTCNVKFRIM